jgi:hypothetical protein
MPLSDFLGTKQDFDTDEAFVRALDTELRSRMSSAGSDSAALATLQGELRGATSDNEDAWESEDPAVILLQRASSAVDSRMWDVFDRDSIFTGKKKSRPVAKDPS